MPTARVVDAYHGVQGIIWFIYVQHFRRRTEAMDGIMYDRLWHRAFVRVLEFLGDILKVMSLEPCQGTEWLRKRRISVYTS